MLRRVGKPVSDSHLRSSAVVTGYHVEATDGEIGHVDGFVLDDETWAIRYIEVATRNWFPGKKVLVSPEWIDGVSWEESKVRIALTREAVKEAPEYLLTKPMTREYERSSTFTMDGRRIGCRKPNTRLLRRGLRDASAV